VGPRTGLDDVVKRKFLTLLGLELRSLCRPAHSKSLYQLHYPGYHQVILTVVIGRSRKSTERYRGRAQRFYHLEMNKLFVLSWPYRPSALAGRLSISEDVQVSHQYFSVIKYICFSLKSGRYA
jgi:hypothetical protein